MSPPPPGTTRWHPRTPRERNAGRAPGGLRDQVTAYRRLRGELEQAVAAERAVRVAAEGRKYRLDLVCSTQQPHESTSA